MLRSRFAAALVAGVLIAVFAARASAQVGSASHAADAEAGSTAQPADVETGRTAHAADAGAPPGARAADIAADEAAIAEFNRRYLKAINDGDIETLASLTTEGHMMIASGGPPLVGKTALVDAMTRAFQTTEIDESWAPEETVVSGDLAYQRGTFVVVAKPKAGGAESRTTGNFLRIYRRQPDGAWLMVRDMFNSQQPRSRQ